MEEIMMNMMMMMRVRHQVTKATIFPKILMKIHSLLFLMILYALKGVIRLIKYCYKTLKEHRSVFVILFYFKFEVCLWQTLDFVFTYKPCFLVMLFFLSKFIYLFTLLKFQQSLYELTLELREKRLNMEESLQEERRTSEQLKKEQQAVMKKMKLIEVHLKQAVDAHNAFQLEKQRKLNELDVVVPLHLHQV